MRTSYSPAGAYLSYLCVMTKYLCVGPIHPRPGLVSLTFELLPSKVGKTSVINFLILLLFKLISQIKEEELLALFL